jgi:hypothetical protein
MLHFSLNNFFMNYLINRIKNHLASLMLNQISIIIFIVHMLVFNFPVPNWLLFILLKR